MNMRPTTLAAFVLACVAAAPARAGVSCSPQASGVAGVIANQNDVIVAINCVGRQIADLRNGAGAGDRAQAARIDELARQITMLQFAIDGLARRISLLEAAAIDIRRTVYPFEHSIYPPPYPPTPRQ